jgi:hypothetical protein
MLPKYIANFRISPAKFRMWRQSLLRILKFKINFRELHKFQTLCIVVQVVHHVTRINSMNLFTKKGRAIPEEVRNRIKRPLQIALELNLKRLCKLLQEEIGKDLLERMMCAHT